MINYEEKIDSLSENTQMDFLQYSIDVIGLQEGPDVKGTLKKIWEKIKSAWEWIRKKIREGINWIKSKFKSKEKDADQMAKATIAKAKSPDADKNATTALVTISKGSVANANRDSSSKSSDNVSAKIIATSEGITYKIINKNALSNIGSTLEGAVDEAADMVVIFRNTFAISRFLSNTAAADEEKIQSFVSNSKTKIKNLENDKNNLVKSINAKFVSAGVVKSIYESYKMCEDVSNVWEGCASNFDKLMNQAISDCNKFTNTIEQHASSSDSNDNERRVLAKAHTLISTYNTAIQAYYKTINEVFKTISSLKNELFMTLHMLYTAYNKQRSSQSQSGYDNGSRNARIGQNPGTGVAVRSRGDVSTY